MNKAKQITEPFAIRLNPKIKIELESLIKEYKDRGTQGEFIELLIETFKTNELSNGITNIETDLNELNTLTSRMYSLYSNLIEKSNTNMDSLKSKMHGKIEDLTEKVPQGNNLTDRINENIEDIKILKEEYKADTEQIKALELSLDSITSTNKELEYKLAAIDMEHKREMDILENDLEAKNIRESWKIKENYPQEIKDLQDKNFKDREDKLEKSE